VDTAGRGSGVRSHQGLPVSGITTIQGHQSQSDDGCREVASPAPVVADTGVVLVRSFTGRLATQYRGSAGRRGL